MPELPEVTTITSDLNKLVKGKKVSGITTDTPKLIRPLKIEDLNKFLTGLTFIEFKRKGKYVIGILGKGNKPSVAILWHMRMTGHLLYRDEKKETSQSKKYFSDPRNQFIRCSIKLNGGSRLDFSDVRKFGTLKVVHGADLESSGELSSLGPDALKTRWTGMVLKKLFEKRKKVVKQLLLDQKVLAGIGNIYADEILWTSMIHPNTFADKLTDAQYEVLAKSIREVLKRGVLARGTSIDDYRDLGGRKGGYGKLRRVYQRTGEPCFRCGKTIARMVVGGRGTHYCPNCQTVPAKREKGRK